MGPQWQYLKLEGTFSVTCVTKEGKQKATENQQKEEKKQEIKMTEGEVKQKITL